MMRSNLSSQALIPKCLLEIEQEALILMVKAMRKVIKAKCQIKSDRSGKCTATKLDKGMKIKSCPQKEMVLWT